MPSDFSNSSRTKLLPLIATAATGGTDQIRDIASDYWFGPLQPVRPVAPSTYRPRQYAYTPGGNLIWTPKGESPINFEVLRALADSWDLLRLVIETQKDRLCTTKFEIRVKPKPGEKNTDRKKRNAEDPKVQVLHKFFKSPDGVHTFQQWLRMLIEDMLVVDAMAVYLARDAKGQIHSMHPLDGATINRLITEQGFTPPPPSPAYQQVVYGTPACDLTTDDLVYFMRNERTDRRYGYAPVEQILITISIALRRQQFQLEYYTSGNVPEALAFLPNDLPIDKVKEVQDWFDSQFAGDLAQRRRLTFLPGFGKEGDAKPSVVFSKEALLKDEMDEWLARIACFCMGVSPQPFLKMMNRATSEQAQETSQEEGQAPFEDSIEQLLNVLLQQKLGYEDYEFVRPQQVDIDVLKQAQADNLLVGKVYTVNEVRERRGEDPREEENAAQLGMFTATGFVPLDQVEDEEDEEPGDDPTTAQGKPNGKPNGKPQKGTAVMAVGFQPTQSMMMPPAPQFFEVLKHAAKGKKKKADYKDRPHHEHGTLTEVGKKAAANIETTIATLLSKMQASVVKMVSPKFKKITDDELETLFEKLDAKLDKQWAELPDDIYSDLEESFLSGASEAAIKIEITLAADLLATVNEEATGYARDRGAEMVGMRYVNGKLVRNPNADMAISKTTREDLRRIITEAFEDPAFTRADFIDRLEEAGTFSRDRATVIANTEVAIAQTEANVSLWRVSGVVQGTEWFISMEANLCDECAENDGEVRALGQEFPSGDLQPPVHPNCRCVIAPVLTEESK